MREDCRPYRYRLRSYNLSGEERQLSFTRRGLNLFYGSVPILLLCFLGLTLHSFIRRTSEDQLCLVVCVPLGQPTASDYSGSRKPQLPYFKWDRLSMFQSFLQNLAEFGTSLEVPTYSASSCLPCVPHSLAVFCLEGPFLFNHLHTNPCLEHTLEEATWCLRTPSSPRTKDINTYGISMSGTLLGKFWAREPMVCRYTVWQESWDT